tara:strand:- start:1924 stop:2562 length:639 start_codon:yes stop_codon:yes gene_type:complete
VEILTSNQRNKIDESDDSEFYSNPKFVYHLDSNFRKYLTKTYEREIDNDSKILDLMSSWDSYLPRGLSYKKVIGHGMNKAELERNKLLDNYWIQNLNKNQILPLENNTVDYCLIVAGWQYLQYPEKISTEISRILTDQGKILISFSNRAFWHKSPNIWTYSNEEERVAYVRRILISNGFKEPKIIRKFMNNNFTFLNFIKSDPFYCLIAQKG